jgi:RNA polymerase sigma-70 factor (ECF subfamily)
LRRYAWSLLRNREDADDLVHDCLARALDKLHTRRDDADVRAWLFTILHNHFLNDRRRANASPIDVDSEVIERVATDTSSPVETVEDALVQQASDDQVRAALELVPEAFRQAVWLRDAEGFSYVEIAEMLRVPVGTVMSRISRGRRLLAAALRTTRRDEVGKHA